MPVWRVKSQSLKGSLLETVFSVRNLALPNLNQMTSLNIPQTVSRLIRAIYNGERIAIFGDYDCDGICASAIMAGFLEKIGLNVIVRLPERKEGFGLKPEQVRELHERGTDIVITVDNGIKAIDAVNAAKSLGMDIIITDHHEPGNILPDTPYIVNPRVMSGFKDYSGAGVAYLLCCELAKALKWPEPVDLVDLAGLATVVDVCPITGENFIIARRGMLKMRQFQRPGLAALTQVARISNVNGYSMGWQIGPRVNAAGRMDTPKLAYELLTCKTTSMAQTLARRLDDMNRRRQELVNKAFSECVSVYKGQVFPIFLINYPYGIAGVVAGKLAETICRPVLVGSVEGDMVRASGRTVGGFNLLAALEECQGKTGSFIRFGGHKKAAGVTFPLKEGVKISRTLAGIARRKLQPEDTVKHIDIDAVLDRPVTVDEVAELDRLEPFGEENPEPVFALCGNVEVLRHGAGWTLAQVNGIKFFLSPDKRVEGSVQIALKLQVNDYDGEIIGKVVDIRAA